MIGLFVPGGDVGEDRVGTEPSLRPVHLKMQMAAGGVAGGTHVADDLTGFHMLAFTDNVLQQMPVTGGVAAVMLNDHIVAVAVPVAPGHNTVPGVGLDHRAGGRCQDGRAAGPCNVNAGMAAYHPLADVPVSGGRPDKVVAVDAAVHIILQLGAGDPFFRHRIGQDLDLYRLYVSLYPVHRGHVLGDLPQTILSGLEHHGLAVVISGGFLGINRIGDFLLVGLPLDGPDFQRVRVTAQLPQHISVGLYRVREKEPVHQLDIMYKGHPLVGIVHLLVRQQTALQKTAQVVTVGGHIPVSYTHLDVYKRQTKDGPEILTHGWEAPEWTL